MVRLLVSILFIVGVSQARAADEIYLSSSQKAALSLGLKAALLKDEDLKKDQAEYIIKTMLSRAKFLASQEKRVLEVASYEQFIKLQKNDELFQNKLANIEVDSLLEVMPDPIYMSKSERVQRRINNYYAQKMKMAQIVAATAFGVSFKFATDSENISVEDFQKFAKEKVEGYINNFVERMTKNTNSPYVSLVAKLLKMYFELLPTSQKTEILFRVMQLPLKPDVNEVFLTMIQNTGPQMQKLVQIIGRNAAIPEEFRAIFQRLESQVQPVPWSEVKKLISSEVNLNDFVYFEHEPIGVGTMAQTHRAQRKGLAHNLRTSVIRFLKPGIEKLVDMDRHILVQIANYIDTDPELKKFKLPSLRRQVDDVHESVVEELDLILTAQNQVEASKVYEKAFVISYSGQKNILQVHVPSTEVIGKNKKLMLQELIFGKKVASEIANYKDIYPELYPAVAEKVTELWLDQAFFKSGFFHADLHQGNILMKVTDDRVQENLLDFGMVGHLSQTQRDSVLMLALGIKLDNPGLIADSFANLTREPLDTQKKSAFETEVLKRVKEIKSGEETSTSIEAWAAWAISKGIDLHYEFVKLNRGIMAISSLLDESKSKESFESIGTGLILKNKVAVLKALSTQKHVTYSDLIKLGLEQLKTKDVTSTELAQPLSVAPFKPVEPVNGRYRCESLF